VVQPAQLLSTAGADGAISDGSGAAGGDLAAGTPAAEQAAAPPSLHSPGTGQQHFGSPVRQRLAALKSPAANSPSARSPGKSPAKGLAASRPALGEHALMLVSYSYGWSYYVCFMSAAHEFSLPQSLSGCSAESNCLCGLPLH
jgi:hypothetical protein